MVQEDKVSGGLVSSGRKENHSQFSVVLLGNRGGNMTDSSKKKKKITRKVGKMEGEDIIKGFTQMFTVKIIER